MDINELKSKIDVLNKRSAQVNTVRNQNIGKRETLKAQCTELFKQYNEKYGVSLTPETLNAEIQAVVDEKAKEVNKLESVLAAVDAGNYSQANALLGIEYQDEVLTQVGVNSERVLSEQEIMNRDFNATNTDFAKVVAPQPTQTEPEVSQPVASQPVAQAVPNVVETSAVQEDIPAAPPVAPSVQPSIPVDEPVAPPVAPPKPSNPVPTAPSPAKPAVSNAFDFASTFEEDDDVVAPPPVKNKPASNPNDVMAGFVKPGMPKMSGLNMETSPTPPSEPKKPVASFEAMFGGGQFHGNN